MMGLAWLFVKPFIPQELLLDPDYYGDLPVPTTSPGDTLLTVWVRWDAIHHLNLARLGYFGLSEGDSVFYPLYAGLVRGFAALTAGDLILSGLMVSTIAAAVAFTFLYLLAHDAYGEGPARWSVIALAVFPTALFLIAPYTESLYLALTCGAFLAAWRRRWWWVALLGSLASLTRGPGMLTAVPIAVIAYQEWVRSRPRLLGRWGLSVLPAVAFPVLAGLAFARWRALMGFPPIPEILASYSGLTMTNPASGLIAAIRQWLLVRDLPTTLDVLSALVFVSLTALMIPRPRWRKPEWVAYMLLNLFVALSKQSFVASSLQSMSRYVLVLFPAFILIGDCLHGWRGQVRFAYLVLTGAALMTLSALYALWFFVG